MVSHQKSFSLSAIMSFVLFIIFPINSSYAASHTINYTLAKAGRVSLNIFDANGHVVRELLHAEPQMTGTHNITWDGKDRSGVDVPNGNTCTWKLLFTPSGLHADYLATLATFPYGPEDRDWIHQTAGVGNHLGPRSVALDTSGVYMGAGQSEGCANAIKMGLDGTWKWGANPPTAWMGRYALSSMAGILYHLEQDQYVAGHGINTPNTDSKSVGNRPDCSGNYVGFYWDALWVGDKRGDADNITEPIMDMAAYQYGSNQQMVISYHNHNAVCWFLPMPNGGDNRTAGPIPNPPLDTVTVSAPLGVAIDNAGNVLICSGNTILKIAYTSNNRAHGAAAAFISNNLNTPYRLDVDRSNGDILVAEGAPSWQVKRFNSAGILLNTYGTYGGRKWGLYCSRDFLGVTDICSDNKGGFYITEGRESGINRLAHFDKNGALLKEWYAGVQWCPYASPEPDNPSIVWTDMSRDLSGRLQGTKDGSAYWARCIINFSKKTFEVHSVYKIDGLANGLINGCVSRAGESVWTVRKHNGIPYLCLEQGGGIQILRVDTLNWKLLPVVKGFWGTDVGGNQYAYLWTDANGNGMEDTGERTTYGTWINFAVRNVHVDENFNYYYLRREGYGYPNAKIVKIPVTGWNRFGNSDWAPLYRNLKEADSTSFALLPKSCLNSDGSLNIKTGNNNDFSTGPDGSLFANFDIGDQGWGACVDARMVKWDANGNFQWEVGKTGANHDYGDMNHIVNPGEIWSAFRTGAGVAHGCVIAADYNGGNSSRSDWTAFEYCWDKDGLWVGNPFEAANCNKTFVPIVRYTLSSDNGSAALYTDPVSGDVYYYGGHESEIRIFKITGWNGWVRMSAKVDNALGEVVVVKTLPRKTPKSNDHSRCNILPRFDGKGNLRFSIQLAKPGSFSLCIHNSQGRQIWNYLSEKLNTGTYQVYYKEKDARINLANGVYFVNLNQDQKSFTRKFIFIQ